MNIILFSREQGILEHWQQKLTSLNPSKYNEIINCSTFKALGEAIADENHVLLFHLADGEIEEKICYQFITKYQQQQKMLVLVNKPDSSQGLRIFRAKVHGYSNTYMGEQKLHTAIDVISQGKIWMGANILEHLLKDCNFRSALNDNHTNVQETDVKEADMKETDLKQQKTNTEGSFLGSLFKGVKKLFG